MSRSTLVKGFGLFLLGFGLIVLSGSDTLLADNKQNIEDAKKGVETLKKSKNAKERAEVIAKLGKFGQDGLFKHVEAAIPQIIEALDDKDDKVRAAAAYAIGQIGPDDPEEVVKKLTALAKDDKEEAVKTNALKGLAELGDKAKSASKPLRELKKAETDQKGKFAKQIDMVLKAIDPKPKK